VLLDQIIEANLDLLFSGMEIVERHMFRVTRNADLSIEEDEADDLLMAIEEELRGGASARRFARGRALDAGGDAGDPAPGLGLGDDDAYEIRGMLDLTGLRDLVDLDRPDLKNEPWLPVTPPRLVPPDEDEPADVFAAIRLGDLLVHHPYENFATSSSGSSARPSTTPRS
jgi:polyphosphate kinase